MSEFILITFAIAMGYLTFSGVDKFCNFGGGGIHKVLTEEDGFCEGSVLALIYYSIFQAFGIGLALCLYIIPLGFWPPETRGMITSTISAWFVLFALKFAKEFVSRIWHHICVGQGKALDYYENYKIEAAKKNLLREQAAKEQLTAQSASIPARGVLEEIN